MGLVVGYLMPKPEDPKYDSVAFLAAALDREGLKCGGDLTVQVSRGTAMNLDSFETGSCPTFAGDDQADFYVFEGDEALAEWHADVNSRRSAGVSGVLGSNWFVSVRSEATARDVEAAIGGKITGY